MNLNDFIPSIETIDRISGVGIIVGFAVLVIMDKFVWHTRYKAAEARADRWERIALQAMTSGARAGVQVAETALEVVSKIPEPTQGEEGST